MFFGKRFMGHRMSENLSGLDVLVLSIIKNNPKISGYDISQKINEKFKGMYKASAGTIYPLLNRLTEKKYLQVEEILEHNRQKKLYTVTEEGFESLKEVLESNLRHSIDTLGDFVRTVIKAFPVRVNFDDCFCGWPSQGMNEEIDIDEQMYTLENIEKVKRILERLEIAKKRHERRMKRITKQVEKYKNILKNLEEGRKRAKPIEIVDDDEEFENF